MSNVAAPEFNISFTPALRKAIKAKVGLFGPSGSGKTLAAMRIAMALQDQLDPTKKIAVIDSEYDRVALYAEEDEFLDENGEVRFWSYVIRAPFSPAHYNAAIEKAHALQAQVLLIDSITPEWAGKGGVQQIVDEAAARQTGGNKWAGWSVGTPAHNSFIEAILGTDLHIVATMRSKTEWLTLPSGQPKKIGLAPIQREGIEYEFDVVLNLDLDHSARVETSRSLRWFPPGTAVPADQVGATFAAKVYDWLTEGVRDEVSHTAPDVQREQETAEGIAAEQRAAEQETAPPPAQQETLGELPAQPPAGPAAEEAAGPAKPEASAAEGADSTPISEPETSAAAQDSAGEAAVGPAPESEAGGGAPESEAPAPAEESAETKAELGPDAIQPSTKGQITKAIKALQEKHGDWEDGTDWNARLTANLPQLKWNTRGVTKVDDLTDDEGHKLLATIAQTDETIVKRKAEAAQAA